MLSVFFGPDTLRARRAFTVALAEFREQHPNAPVFRFADDYCGIQEVVEAISTGGLFGDPGCVVLDGLAERAEGEEVLRLVLQPAAESANTVFLLETAPKKDLKEAVLSIVPKSAVWEFVKTEKKDDGANFALGDALAAKDKRRFWELLMRLYREGYAPEELHGTLWWVAKSLFIAKKCTESEATEAGVKGYAYKKFKGFSQAWTERELENLIGRLKDMPHERGHKMSGNLSLILEEFVLSL